MYSKNLITVPRIPGNSIQSSALEWELPGRVKVAFMFIEKYGYTLTAKIQVKKKHWWNRSWQVESVNDPSPEEALRQGRVMLEGHGYELDYDSGDLKEWIGNQCSS